MYTNLNTLKENAPTLYEVYQGHLAAQKAISEDKIRRLEIAIDTECEEAKQAFVSRNKAITELIEKDDLKIVVTMIKPPYSHEGFRISFFRDSETEVASLLLSSDGSFRTIKTAFGFWSVERFLEMILGF